MKGQVTMSHTGMKLAAVEPDWQGMFDNLRRRGTTGRVFYFEHGLTPGVINAVCDLAGAVADDGSREVGFRRRLECHRFLGHEFFRVHPPGGRFAIPECYAQQGFTDQRRGPVQSWADFEAFQWPDPNAADFSSGPATGSQTTFRSGAILPCWMRPANTAGSCSGSQQVKKNGAKWKRI